LILYVDSSALVKRVIAETESEALEQMLADHVARSDALVASSLAWIEVERAVRALADAGVEVDVGASARLALSGIAERPIGADVVSLARRIQPAVLRSLDAIHLSTAVLVDADLIITYDERLGAAARASSIQTVAPGEPPADG
jgi:predicted nucleic acid-binding protein